MASQRRATDFDRDRRTYFGECWSVWARQQHGVGTKWSVPSPSNEWCKYERPDPDVNLCSAPGVCRSLCIHQCQQPGLEFPGKLSCLIKRLRILPNARNTSIPQLNFGYGHNSTHRRMHIYMTSIWQDHAGSYIYFIYIYIFDI